MADYVASGLLKLGLPASQNTKIGICTKSRAEFIITMLGTSRFSMVLVPVYESLDCDAISFIISQVEMQAIICESLKFYNFLAQNATKFPHLKHIILMEDNCSEVKTSCFNVMTFKELMELGKSHIGKPKKPESDDLFCICYTSGTTGQPKGVMVTHHNVFSCIAAMNALLKDALPIHRRMFAFLPCAHIYEIINEVYCLYSGGELGFYSGCSSELLNDIDDLKPTVLPMVPKIMNHIYFEVKKEIESHILKKLLLKIAVHQKTKDLKRGIISRTTIWDKFVFAKIQKLFGGNVQIIVCASAPIAEEVMQFFRCASGCLIVEAYGLSEAGAVTLTLMSEHESGFVGPPLPSNHIKLVSVPELNYDAANDSGEICIRGPNVFLGYYKNAKATKEVLDSAGWFHTGDIGKWLPNGCLQIIDRKKHIFKLSQGEYIAPDKCENIYVQSPILSQVYVDGISSEDFPIAVVVPEKEAFIKWAKSKDFEQCEFENLCRNKEVKISVLRHMLQEGKKMGLNSLHQIGNIYISPEPFNSVKELITPTMKLKRSKAFKYFGDNIQQLYHEGNLRKKLGL